MEKKVAMCPGSFDPITNRHLDIITRGSKVFDKVIVDIFNNSTKKSLITIEKRIELIKQSFSHLPNVTVDVSEGLLIEYAKEHNIKAVLRGLRAISDFEYEMQITSMNKRLAEEVDTFFMMTNNKYSFLSSSIVKEVAQYHGDISGLVPDIVEQALKEKFKA